MISRVCLLNHTLRLLAAFLVITWSVSGSTLFGQFDPVEGNFLGDSAEIRSETHSSAQSNAASSASRLQKFLKHYASGKNYRRLTLAIKESARIEDWSAVNEYLGKLDSRTSDRAMLKEVAGIIGGPLLVRMRLQQDLEPSARKFVDTLRRANSDGTRTAPQIRTWISQIDSSDIAIRAAAYQGLLGGGDTAIAELVMAVIDAYPDKLVERDHRLRVLTKFGSEAREALRQMTLYGAESVRSGALDALAILDRKGAIPDLVTAAYATDATETEKRVATIHLQKLFDVLPSRNETEMYLLTRLRNKARGALQPTTWDARTHWNPIDGKRIERTIDSKRTATLRPLFDSANRLKRIGSLSRKTQTEAILQVLGFQIGTNPQFGTASDQEYLVSQWGADALSDPMLETMLMLAVKQGRCDAAVAAIRLLGLQSNPRVVVSHTSNPTPLVNAASHSDPQVRFEAALAIARMQITQPYAGSSNVLRRWVGMASLGRLPKAIVMEPRKAQRPSTQRTLLQVSGFQVESFSTVIEVVRRVNQGGDLQVILADSGNLPNESVNMVARVRRSPLGRSVPIILYGMNNPISEDARKEGFITHEPTLATSQGLAAAMESVNQARPLPSLSASDRLAYSLDAVEILGSIAANPKQFPFYDLHAVDIETVLARDFGSVVIPKLEILSGLGTSQSQWSLANMAVSGSLSRKVREYATEAFVKSVTRFGIRLTRQDIISQYQRFNRSTNPQVRKAFTKVLGAMEKRAGMDPTR